MKASDAGKVIPLDWALPFPADWRVDFPRTDELTDSWQMLLQDKKGGSYTKPSFLGSGEDSISSSRDHSNMVLGGFKYPCWSDFDQKAYLQPLQSSVLKFQGTTVIYPINRVKQTPLDAYTVVDVMRNTLGVGPCEQLLDLEGQRIINWKGMATCHVRDKLNTIYEKKQQQEKRADVDKTLDDGLTFVKDIRSRIIHYVEFSHAMRDYLAEQKKAHPELADSIAELEKLNQEVDKRMEARLPHIKTPAYVASINEDFRKKVLGYERPRRLGVLQGVHRSPGGSRPQPGRACGRMPLCGQGFTAACGHSHGSRPTSNASCNGDPHPHAGSLAQAVLA